MGGAEIERMTVLSVCGSYSSIGDGGLRRENAWWWPSSQFLRNGEKKNEKKEKKNAMDLCVG